MNRIYRLLISRYKFYSSVYSDRRTPFIAKLFIGLAMLYLISPVDLIPDFIPVIGYVDDILIVPLLVWAGLRFIPGEVMEECRSSLIHGER